MPRTTLPSGVAPDMVADMPEHLADAIAPPPERRPGAPDLASLAAVDALVASILRAQFTSWADDGGRPPNAVRAVEDAERHIREHCGDLLARWATGVLRERYPLKRFPLDAASEATLLRTLR